MLKEGIKAPDFELPDSEGKTHTLKEFRGSTVILYFYPKDDTVGCTREACDFRDLDSQFSKKNAVVIGISADSQRSHANFTVKHGLNFLLLCDTEKETMRDYHVLREKNLYGRKFLGIERTTFIIDRAGTIKKIFPEVNVGGHADAVLDSL